MTDKCSILRDLIRAPKLLVMPTAYDPLSAKLIQEAGYDAVQCSGLGIAASRYGMPDLSIVSMREMVEATRVIAQAVDLPVMGDADTGYGNAVNTWYTVREFERAGAAGVNLEDQVLPKRCGRLEGKDVISITAMVGKIEAAADARGNKNFVINARTDALPLYGIEDVIKRGNAYFRAGATMFFVEGVRSREEIKKLVASIDGPLAMNLMEDEIGNGLNDITFTELKELGVARVSLSVTTLLAAMRGVRRALEKIRESDGTRFDSDLHISFPELHTLAGTDFAVGVAKRFDRA